MNFGGRRADVEHVDRYGVCHRWLLTRLGMRHYIDENGTRYRILDDDEDPE